MKPFAELKENQGRVMSAAMENNPANHGKYLIMRDLDDYICDAILDGEPVDFKLYRYIPETTDTFNNKHFFHAEISKVRKIFSEYPNANAAHFVVGSLTSEDSNHNVTGCEIIQFTINRDELNKFDQALIMGRDYKGNPVRKPCYRIPKTSGVRLANSFQIVNDSYVPRYHAFRLVLS